MTSMHFHAWKKGLKTGMYYLRSKAATDAIQFTVDKEQLAKPVTVTEGNVSLAMVQEQKQSDIECSLDDPDDCIACGS